MVCVEQISRGIEFQMAGESNGMSENQSWWCIFSREEVVLIRGAKRTDRLVVVDK